MHEKSQDQSVGGRTQKFWHELSIEEKIERTRERVKQLEYRMDDMLKLLNRLLVEFENHSHHDGKILLPLNKGQIPSLGGGMFIGGKNRPENPDEVYF